MDGEKQEQKNPNVCNKPKGCYNDVSVAYSIYWSQISINTVIHTVDPPFNLTLESYIEYMLDFILSWLQCRFLYQLNV